MASDIEWIIERVTQARPDVAATQLKAKHAVDDAGLWFFRKRGAAREVQLESSSGDCPFLVEADYDNGARHTARSIDEAVLLVLRLLDR